jgi:hypothetical protein
MPLWAVTTLCFLRSFESRRIVDAALAGAAAAASMYGKYWSIMLLAGLGVAALLDSRRWSYFRSAAPWVSIAVGALALAPNLYSLVTHDFGLFSYAFDIHGGRSLMTTLQGVIGYLAGAAAYVAIPVIIALIETRPSRTAARDMLWPANPERRLAATAFWATLLLPSLFALATGLKLTSLWTMPAWTLLPIVLLSSPLLAIGRRMRPASLRSLAFFHSWRSPLRPPWPSSRIAAACHRSVRILRCSRYRSSSCGGRPAPAAFTCSAGYGVSFYLPGRPLVVPALERGPPAELDERIARDGIALAVRSMPPGALRTPRREPHVRRRASGSRSRSCGVFLGLAGPAARYLIVAIPPRG